MRRLHEGSGEWSGSLDDNDRQLVAPEGAPINLEVPPVSDTFHSGRTSERNTDRVGQVVPQPLREEELETIDLQSTHHRVLPPGRPKRYNPQSIFDLRSRTWVALFLTAAAVSCPAKRALKEQTAGCSTVPFSATVDIEK